MTFLEIRGHPGFSANRNAVRVDKALKYSAGIWYAIRDHQPEYMVLFDGDDFVHSNFTDTVLKSLKIASDDDGLIITSGYNVALKPKADGFALLSAFKVREFNKTCGSCRVFRTSALKNGLLEVASGIQQFDAPSLQTKEGSLVTRFLDLLVEAGDTTGHEEAGFLNTIGRHGNQKVQFKLAECDLRIVAKGCGHGNHDGPRAGEVHWHRIIGLTGNKRWLKAFGLANHPEMVSQPNALYQIRGLRAAFKLFFRGDNTNSGR